MDVVLDRIVFRRQAEGVVAHGEQNVLSLHPMFARDHVHRGIRAGMADMQAGAGGVRELDQCVKLLFIRAGFRLIKLLIRPDLVPFVFNGRKIVFHFASSSKVIGTCCASFQRRSRS